MNEAHNADNAPTHRYTVDELGGLAPEDDTPAVRAFIEEQINRDAGLAATGLHPCEGCAMELDGDDLHTLCDDCEERYTPGQRDGEATR